MNASAIAELLIYSDPLDRVQMMYDTADLVGNKSVNPFHWMQTLVQYGWIERSDLVRFYR